MSGRLHASGAGERSSVFVSPGTLKTVTVIFRATSGREVNQSASAQLWITCFACTLPAFAFSATSWKKSNISSVFRSEEHTSELQSRFELVCRLLLEKKKLILDVL